jgi:GH25 family lysozyme M1 (1,4-beta-N-acetylmuramidase)
MLLKYIDISSHQKEIDWEKVKGNVDGVIIRAGYGKNKKDACFERNASECNRLGIPCGAYWFSYAYTPAMAQREAEHLIMAVEPYRMELPLAFDFEYDSVRYAGDCGVTVTKKLATEMVYAFCETVEKAGYFCLNYANPDYLNRYFDETVPQRFALWLALYPNKIKDLNTPPRDCVMWQWGGSAVPGITGNVDTNAVYKNLKKLIADAGFNRLQQKPVVDDSWYTVKFRKADAETIAKQYGGELVKL